MSDGRYVTRLVEDAEEEFAAEGILPLYNFGWALRGLGATEDEAFFGICLTAYEQFRRQHPEVGLVWVRWPIETSEARAVTTDVTLDFDLDVSDTSDRDLLALARTERPSAYRD